MLNFRSTALRFSSGLFLGVFGMLLFANPQSIAQAARESVESLAAKIVAIINGTTVVGHASNSDKLAGLDSSHYFNKDSEDLQYISADTYQYSGFEYHEGTEYHWGTEYHDNYYEEHNGDEKHWGHIFADRGIQLGSRWDNREGTLSWDYATHTLWAYDGFNWRRVQFQ